MPTYKAKNKYEVFRVIDRYGECGQHGESREFIGTTWAVSEDKAVNNVRYRVEGKVANYRSHDLGQENSIDISYEAVKVWPVD